VKKQDGNEIKATPLNAVLRETSTHTPTPPHPHTPLKNGKRLLYCVLKKRAKKQAQKSQQKGGKKGSIKAA